jgi:hypothetical protein
MKRSDLFASESRRSPRAQHGQSSLEWGGVVALISAVVAVLFTLGVPQKTGHSVECSVASILHQTVAACEPPPPADRVNCITGSDTQQSNTSVEVSFVKVGHNQTLIKTTYSNGQVQYTLTDKDSAQAQADLFEAGVQVGDFGLDAQADASAGGELDGAHVWTFPNQAAADAFQQKVDSSGGWGQVAHDLAGPVGGWILNHIGIHGAPNPNDLDPKNLSYSYTGASVIGQINFDGNAGLGSDLSGQLKASLQAAGGFRVIQNASSTQTTTGQSGSVPLANGDIQVFVSLNGSADAALRATLFGPGASIQGNGVATVTMSPTGQLLQLQVSASADGTGNGAGKATSGDGQGSGEDGSGATAASGDEGGGSLASKLGITFGNGQGYSYTGTLDLQNDPTAQADLVTMLAGNQQSVSDLVSQMNSSGTQRVQPYSVSRTKTEIGIEGEVVDVGGGVNGTVTDTNQQYAGGWIHTPGGQWIQVNCER